MLSEISTRRLISPPFHLSSSQLNRLNKQKYWKCTLTSLDFQKPDVPKSRKSLPKESLGDGLKDYGGTEFLGNEDGKMFEPSWAEEMKGSIFGLIVESDVKEGLEDVLVSKNNLHEIKSSEESEKEKQESETVKSIFGYNVDLTLPPPVIEKPVVPPLETVLKPKISTAPPPPKWSQTYQPSIIGLIPSQSSSLNISALKIQLWFKRCYIFWALRLRTKRREDRCEAVSERTRRAWNANYSCL